MAQNVFEYKLNRIRPIEASFIADSIMGISRRYKSFIYQKADLRHHYEDELFLYGVKDGSDIFQFLPVAIATTLPLLSDANTISQFFSHMKQLMEFFKGNASEPQKIKPKVCDDIMKIVQPTMQYSSGMQFNVIEGNVTVNSYNITIQESEKIFDSAVKKKALLQEPTSEIIHNQKMHFIQSRIGSAKTEGYFSADKGVIRSIDSKAYSIIFDEEIESYKQELVMGNNNIFTSEFVVDAIVIKVDGKIKAYHIQSIKPL